MTSLFVESVNFIVAIINEDTAGVGTWVFLRPDQEFPVVRGDVFLDPHILACQAIWVNSWTCQDCYRQANRFDDFQNQLTIWEPRHLRPEFGTIDMSPEL